MAPTWDVDFGDFVVEDVEASTEDGARRNAIERLKERADDADVRAQYSVYTVTQRCTGCKINVRARSRAEAEDAVRKYTQDRIDELRDVAPPGQSRSFLADLSTGAKCKGEAAGDHYELTEDGTWDEGEL